MNISGHDVLMQHIRLRMDDGAAGVKYSNRDALAISNYPGGEFAYNIVVDHCSFSWGMDENVDIGSSSSNHDITFSNNIVSEGLYDSHHPDGPHSKGIFAGGGLRLFIVNNLVAHCHERSAVAINPARTDILIANNLIYNSGLPYVAKNQNKDNNIDWVGNSIIGGPNFRGSVLYYPDFIFNQTNSVDFYVAGTRIENFAGSVFTQSSSKDWSRVKLQSGSDDGTYCKNTRPTFAHPSGWSAMDSANVETYVLANAGARPADRDSADKRIVNDVRKKTGRIINSPSDVGWPQLSKNTRNVTTIGFPSDPHGDDDSDGYTNLEEWLHELSIKVGGNKISQTEPDVPIPPSGLKIIGQ
jgi:hypothetical protein